jgi:UDP-glucose 4-epimerase
VQKVSKVAFDIREGARRVGDPPSLVADAWRIRTMCSVGDRSSRISI